VDEQDRRLPGESVVEVELTELEPAILDDAGRHALDALGQRLGLRATVGLDPTDDDVRALALLRAGRLERRVGLSDARSRAEENLQMPAVGAGILRGDAVKELFRARSPLFHDGLYFIASSARFRRRTFTRDSPRTPNVRGSTCSATNARTRSSGRPRARATR